ncbi:MAG: hypothetical protein ACNS63_04410 [Candidatus Nitrospinota bacterium M3_3B_026]
MKQLQEVRNYVYRVSKATHGRGELDFANYDLLEEVENLITVTAGLLDAVNQAIEEIDAGGEQSRAFAELIRVLRTARDKAEGRAS